MDAMLLAASPVPSVDLSASELPRDGLLITRSKFCDRRFGPECKRHYAALATGPKLIPVQCPFGFASIALPDAGPGFALTGFVPFPRIGGDAERARAKECPSGRVDTGVLVAWSKSLASAQALLRERESQALSSHLEALHEVRRLNHTVKVIMERLCTKAAPGNPDRAPSDLVRGWKASEMISHHLDALDILSNPGLAETPPNKVITFYKLVDQIFRIYQARADEKKVRLALGGHSVAKASVYDGTIHIAPSAFMDNAIKYSREGDQVEVRVFEGALDNKVSVGFEVRSMGPPASAAEERRLFRQRGRGEAAKGLAEGSGVGLVLVRAVAEQHGARATAVQRQLSDDRSEWLFRFELPTTR